MTAQRKALEDHKELFGLLYETARNAGIEIIEDKINRKGGVCRHKERFLVVYDAHATLPERNRLILEAISLVNPDYIYLPPRVRMLLDKKGS